MAKLLKWRNTILYIIMIVLINVAFSFLPFFSVFGREVSPVDPIAGIIYLFRDFAQRELGHYVFIAMIIGAVLSYWFAAPEIAIASIGAFIAGEIIDWSVFTFTKKPLSQRLIWSALLSSPIDSSVFLYFIHRLNILAVLAMTLGKVLGVVVIWYIWQRRAKRIQSAKLSYES